MFQLIVVFAQQKDEAVFRPVRLQFDTIEWSNGADLDTEMLYAESKPADVGELASAL